MVNTQVMQEFFVTVTRRIARPLATPDALAVLDLLALASVAPMDANAVRRAAEATTRHQLSLWDALIVDAAVTAGCDRLLTEDLNAGQVFDGVTVVNPFA